MGEELGGQVEEQPDRQADHVGDAALEALKRASEADLIDIVWLDRCPLFDKLRHMPEFAAIRTPVKRRAR